MYKIKNQRPTHVYVLQMGDTDFYRIGITNNRSKGCRYKILQHGNPYKLKEIFYEYHGSYARNIEKLLLSVLCRYRVRNSDWLNVERQILDEYLS